MAAAAAAWMSRSASPRYRHCAGRALLSSAAASMGAGCGLGCGQVSQETMQAARFTEPLMSILDLAERAGLLVTTPQARPRCSSASSNSRMPGKGREWRQMLSAYSCRNSSRMDAKCGSSGCRSKPRPSWPRAPCEACGRMTSSASGGSPWRARCRLSAWPRSGAVSTRVPSRSNRTARMFSSFTALLPPARRHQVVDVGVGFQLVDLGQRVVGHAEQFLGVEPGFARHAGKLGGLDELGVVVRAARQQLEDVFGADDGEEIALGVAD